MQWRGILHIIAKHSASMGQNLEICREERASWCAADRYDWRVAWKLSQDKWSQTDLIRNIPNTTVSTNFQSCTVGKIINFWI